MGKSHGPITLTFGKKCYSVTTPSDNLQISSTKRAFIECIFLPRRLRSLHLGYFPDLIDCRPVFLSTKLGYSRHDKLTRNTVYTVQTNVISPRETASAVTQLSRSGTRCPLRGSRCGCSSMQFRQQATEEPLPQLHHSRCPSETTPAVTQSPGSPPHGTHAPHYSIPASVTHSGQR